MRVPKHCSSKFSRQSLSNDPQKPLIKMMKLVAFFALLAVAVAKPAPGLIAYSAPAVVAAHPITYTAVHTPAVAVHPAPLVATYAAVPATHSYISGVTVHAAPIEQHGYKIVY